jgi:hypothetical protein
MRAGVAQVGLSSPVVFSLYVNDMPVPSSHVELALYADDSAIIATSRSPALLVSYLDAYLSDLERYVRLQRLQEQCYALCEGRVAVPRPEHLPGTNPIGRHSPLSGSDPLYTDDLVASYHPGHEGSCPTPGSA